MNNYPNAGDGLKKMFIAQVGALICTVLIFIPIINILAAFGAIVFLIFMLVGLNNAGKDIAGCKTAFTFNIANLVLNCLGVIPFLNSGFLGTIVNILEYVCSFLVVYYVCTSVGAALTGIGMSDVADQGQNIWKINLVCYAAVIVISILSVIPLLNILAGIASIIVAIVTIVAEILYVIFLNKSYQAFSA